MDADDRVGRLEDLLGQATKRNVMRPPWRQVPDMMARCASGTLGVSGFRLRGLSCGAARWSYEPTVGPGHRIGGVRVEWAPPLPDHSGVGLDHHAEPVPGAHSDHTLWLRPGALVRVDDADLAPRCVA
jgi:hypothetical protein